MDNIIYRVLTINDLEEYKRIRLELLKLEDENFGSSYEEESSFNIEMWRNRLTKSYIVAFGAFINDDLIGIALGVSNPRKKMKHISTINSVYVAPKHRGLGIARKLLVTLISYLEANSIEIIRLSVVTTNASALKLYKSLGFSSYGIEEGTFKVNERLVDQNLMVRKTQ